ncbi:MAG: hypothetical protein BJ554DRAFT_6640 [Olpidium bornovanus]|uniref:Uncharacterized protein n=1 Tax=Olpidium bornovanus TaxID=278681 RepID=A0A8H7ZXD6_9FUNG|nr:MAG: hypothetical protein BJ554DRAFT_6640 [Olpidium bornovanus]
MSRHSKGRHGALAARTEREAGSDPVVFSREKETGSPARACSRRLTAATPFPTGLLLSRVEQEQHRQQVFHPGVAPNQVDGNRSGPMDGFVALNTPSTKGHLACKECFYENILAQKKEIARQQKEAGRIVALREAAAAKRELEAHQLLLDEFEKSQTHFLPMSRLNKEQSAVGDADRPAQVETDGKEHKPVDANEGDVFQLDVDEMRARSKEEKERALAALEREEVHCLGTVDAPLTRPIFGTVLTRFSAYLLAGGTDPAEVAEFLDCAFPLLHLGVSRLAAALSSYLSAAQTPLLIFDRRNSVLDIQPSLTPVAKGEEITAVKMDTECTGGDRPHPVT